MRGHDTTSFIMLIIGDPVDRLALQLDPNNHSVPPSLFIVFIVLFMFISPLFIFKFILSYYFIVALYNSIYICIIVHVTNSCSNV